MFEVAPLVAMLAAVVPWPPQDRVNVVELTAGGPAAVRTFALDVEIGDRRSFPTEMKVTQTYELDPSHGPLRAGLASEQAGEVERGDDKFPGYPYDPERWGALGLEISADGTLLPWRALTEEHVNLSHTLGHLAFEIPASARRLVLRYWTRLASDQGQDFFDLRPWAFSSWRGPPGHFDVVVKGLGDLPATHVEVVVRTGDAALRQYDGPKPAWTFTRGTLELHGEGRTPPTVVVVVPDGRCARRDCKAAASFDDLWDHCKFGSVCSP
jgi:hypothetical protein